MQNQSQFLSCAPPDSFKEKHTMSGNKHSNSKGLQNPDSRNPAAGSGVRSSSSLHSPAVGNVAGGRKAPTSSPFISAIVSCIMSSSRKFKMIEVYQKVVDFATTYASSMPAKLKRFEQDDVNQALTVFQEEYAKTQQTQARAKLSRNPDNLFGKFLRKARLLGITTEENIISFAKYYTTREVSPEVVENPTQEEIEAMLLFFRQEIARITGNPALIAPEWELYNELFDSKTASLSIDQVKRTFQGALKWMRSAFGGTLPQNGIHKVTNAFIFRTKVGTFDPSDIIQFLVRTRLKGFPAFLYNRNGTFTFDKQMLIQNVKDEQLFVVFLDRCGLQIRIDQPVVRCGGRDCYVFNDHLVEEGLAHDISLETQDYSGMVHSSMVKNDPLLLSQPFPGFEEFMTEHGAFPLMVSFEADSYLAQAGEAGE